MPDPDPAPQLPHPPLGRFPPGAHLAPVHPAARGAMASTLRFWDKTWCFVLCTLHYTCFSLWGRTAMKTVRAQGLPLAPSTAAQFQVPARPLGPWLFERVTRRNLGSHGPSDSTEPTFLARTSNSSWSCSLLPCTMYSSKHVFNHSDQCYLPSFWGQTPSFPCQCLPFSLTSLLSLLLMVYVSPRCP